MVVSTRCLTLTFVVVVVSAVAMVTDGCSPTDEPSDASQDPLDAHFQRLCMFELVFKGRITKSRRSEDDSNIYTMTSFSVIEYFRDTEDVESLTVDIAVDYSKAYMCCKPQPFDLQADIILVYANTENGHHFAFPCVGHPNWNDVPEGFSDGAIHNDPCVEDGVKVVPPPPGDSDFMPVTTTSTTTARTTTTASRTTSTATPATITTCTTISATEKIAGVPVYPEISLQPFIGEVECPIDQLHGVMVSGQISMTGVNLETVAPVADFIYAGMQCRVQLDPCPSSASEGSCYCVAKRGAVYTVKLGVAANASYSGEEVKVSCLNSNLTSVVAESNTSPYPHIQEAIHQRLWTDDDTFSLNEQQLSMNTSGVSDSIELWFEVTGLTVPYQVSIQANEDGPTAVSTNQPTATLTIEPSHKSVRVSYMEMGSGHCSRSGNYTYTYKSKISSGVECITAQNIVTVTLMTSALILLTFHVDL